MYAKWSWHGLYDWCDILTEHDSYDAYDSRWMWPYLYVERRRTNMKWLSEWLEYMNVSWWLSWMIRIYVYVEYSWMIKIVVYVMFLLE